MKCSVGGLCREIPRHGTREAPDLFKSCHLAFTRAPSYKVMLSRKSMSPKIKTVLIVDDDEGMRDTLTTILKREYLVVTAATGEEGLASSSRRTWTWSCWTSAGISGLDLLTIIRKTYSLVEVIMVSPLSEVEVAVAAMKQAPTTTSPKSSTTTPHSRETNVQRLLPRDPQDQRGLALQRRGGVPPEGPHDSRRRLGERAGDQAGSSRACLVLQPYTGRNRHSDADVPPSLAERIYLTIGRRLRE